MLDDKITIVTGGSTGIGRAVAAKFLDDGAEVVVAFLASEEASYITGVSVPVDGGWTAH